MAKKGNALGQMIIGVSMDGTDITKSLKDIRSNIKFAQSEMKANLSVLGQAGSSYDKLTTKIKGLNNVVEAGAKEIEFLKNKHSEAVETYGEGSRVAQNYATKLNRAVEVQGRWSNQLDNANNELKSSTSVLQKHKDELEMVTSETDAYTKLLRSQGKEEQANKATIEGLTKQMESRSKVIDEEVKKYDSLVIAKGADSKETRQQAIHINNLRTANEQASASIGQITKATEQASSSMSRYASVSQGHASELSLLERETESYVSSLRSQGKEEQANQALTQGLNKQIETRSKLIQSEKDKLKELITTKGEDSQETRQQIIAIRDLESANRQAISSIEEVGEAISDSSSGAENTGEKFGGMWEVFKGSFLANGVMAIISKTIGALKSMASSAIIRVDKLDVATKSLKLLTGSAEGAQKAMDAVSGAIKGTPVSMDTMTDSVKGLVASGMKIEKLNGVLQATVDSAYGLGNGAESIDQISAVFKALQSSGVASLGDVTRLVDANVPALKILANQYKVSVDDIKKTLTKGELESEEVIDKLVDGMLKGTKGVAGTTVALKGLAQTAGDSISGSMSNMKSAITRGLANMLTPFKDDLIGLFTWTGQTLEPFFNTLAKTVDTVYSGIKSGFAGLKDSFNISEGGLLGNVLPEKTTSNIVNGILSVKTVFGDFKRMLTTDGTERASILTQYFPESAIYGITTGLDVIRGAWNSFTAVLSGSASYKDIMLKILPVSTVEKISELLNQIKSDFASVFSAIADRISMQSGMFITAFGGIMGSLSSFKDGFLDVYNYILLKFLPIFSQISSIVSTAVVGLVTIWTENSQPLMQAVGNIIKFILGAFKTLLPVIKPIFALVIWIVKDAFNAIMGIVKGGLKVIDGIIKIFSGLFTGNFNLMWTGIKKVFSGAIQLIWNLVNLMFLKKILGLGALLKSGFTKIMTALWSAVKSIFKKPIDWIVNFTKSMFGKMTNTVSTIMGRFKQVILHPIDTMRAVSAVTFGKFKTGTLNIFNSLKSQADKVWKNMVSAVTSIPGKMASGIKKGKNALKSAFVSMFNGVLKAIGKPVNAIIGSVNWIMDKFGSSKTFEKWTVPQYAKGTRGSGHGGGVAMVNDGKGQNYREAIKLPDGKTFIPQGRNVMMNLPKGTQVLSGGETAKHYNIPQYAKGTGGFWKKTKDTIGNGFDATKEFGNKVGKSVVKGANKIKDGVIDVWDYVENPSKILKMAIKEWTNPLINKLPTLPKNVSSGIRDKSLENIGGVAKMIEDETSAYGGGGGSISNKYNVYDSLYAIAKKVMSSKLGKGLVVTSGHRPGDSYDHGKHNAIDLSGFGSNGGYRAVAQWASKLPGVGYTIGDNTVYGRKYGNGSKPKWATGHMNHVHISGNATNAMPTNGGGYGASSPNVQKWRPTVVKALRKNNLPTTPNYVEAWLRQIYTESSGNPNLIGGTDGLNDGRATGLVQVKPPTFKAYKHKGHGNIMNAYDNLLAGMNYAKKRYGATTMLNSIGKGHGYENGGLITRHQIAEIGEKNRPEMVIPLHKSKRTRGVQLLNQASKMMGQDKGNTNFGTSNSSDGKMIELLQTQVEQMGNALLVLTQLLNKDNTVVIGEKDIYNANKSVKDRQSIVTNFAKGI